VKRWKKSERRKRQRFSDECKAETVLWYRAAAKVSARWRWNWGIGETALRRWVEQAEIEAGRVPAGALKRSEREELAALRRENQRVRIER